jgi:predicted aspartyl protease
MHQSTEALLHRFTMMLVLLLAAGVTAAADPEAPAAPTPNPAAGADGLSEVIVQAAEPRYVAPTKRDRIGRIWAPVLINDQGPFRFVLDTGANHSTVSATVAGKLGIPVRTDQAIALRGVTGSRLVGWIPVESLVVGDLELRSKRLPIINDALGGAEGVLGTDGLQDKRIFIDFMHDKITIFRSHSEPPPPGFTTIPIKLVSGLLLVAEVKIGAVRAKAIIDTGGQGTIANAAFKDAMTRRIDPKDLQADEIQGATLDIQRGDRVNAPVISIGGIEISRAHITVGDMYIFQHWKMTNEPAILIGMDVLGVLDTMIIDYKRRELQVKLRG